ncbi:MAG: hypothetical protein ACQKBV_12345 [Puniceicoccales bacterium]
MIFKIIFFSLICCFSKSQYVIAGTPYELDYSSFHIEGQSYTGERYQTPIATSISVDIEKGKYAGLVLSIGESKFFVPDSEFEEFYPPPPITASIGARIFYEKLHGIEIWNVVIEGIDEDSNDIKSTYTFFEDGYIRRHIIRGATNMQSEWKYVDSPPITTSDDIDLKVRFLNRINELQKAR